MSEREKRVVALVTDAIAPYHRGGKEQRYLELAHRLADQAEVNVYTMHWWEGPRVRRDGGVTYHAICPRLPLYSGSRRSIRQAVLFALCCLRLIGRRFDVIEADHMPYIPLLSLKLVALIRRRRLVVTWHECWGPDYWERYLGRPGKLGWLVESLAMRLPDAIIAASPQTAARLVEFTRARVPVVVAPNGIDLRAVDDAEVPSESPDVVVVGRLVPHKRVDLALDALADLRRRGRRVTAQVIGTGPELPALAARAQALGLDDLVQFRDNVATQRELYGLLKAALVAVFPSEREGFGIAVLEALACGTRVITTSAPDNLAQHLVLRAGNRGLVCEPDGAALAQGIATMLERAGEPRGPRQGWLAEYDWAAISHSVAAVLA